MVLVAIKNTQYLLAKRREKKEKRKKERTAKTYSVKSMWKPIMPFGFMWSYKIFYLPP